MGASRLRVLLAESGLTETGLTLRSVCAGSGRVLELVRVESAEGLEQALRAHCPDIALLKLSLLQPDAVHQLRALQENSPSIPFILLAEPADNVSAEMCFALGVADYLVEGYLDERTMNRVLSSAMGEWGPCAYSEEMELGPGWARRGGQEWVFTITMGDEDRGLSRSDAEVLATAAEVVRKCLRSTDEVEAVGGRELVVRIQSLCESKRAMVEKRIEARLRGAAWPLVRQLKLGMESNGRATRAGERRYTLGWS
ncbi:MAG TPA: response regulator [Candidatus Saccharimonadales bacterium]|nr:response regulator [Candidatus Saccharimonadales bacterium]